MRRRRRNAKWTRRRKKNPLPKFLRKVTVVEGAVGAVVIVAAGWGLWQYFQGTASAAPPVAPPPQITVTTPAGSATATVTPSQAATTAATSLTSPGSPAAPLVQAGNAL